MGVYRSKSDYKADPCSVCGAHSIVTWNTIELAGQTHYIPARHDCSARCHETLGVDEWNRRRQHALDQGEG